MKKSTTERLSYFKEIWENANTNSISTISELIEAYKNDERFDIKYCIRRLKEIGAIEVHQSKSVDGRFSEGNILFKKSPEVILKTCDDCRAAFKSKTYGSKHKNICQDCTFEKYMKPRVFECFYCKKDVLRKESKRHQKKIFHNECKLKYIEKKNKPSNKTPADENGVRICPKCEVGELSYRRRFCEQCVTAKTKPKVRKSACGDCPICNKTKVTYGKTCGDIECKVIYYADPDTSFYSGKKNRGIDSDIKMYILGKSCKVCGYDKVVQYHHFIFKENGGLDVLGNLIPLCPNHHQEVHKCGLDISEYHKKVLQRIEDIKNGVIEISL